jgi:glycosyltransferase involved in cell wall biosynthesis
MKYSIVIPTRNNGQTIGMTIESCLLLNYDDFEVIIQDNSSNDETAELVAKIVDSRIKYFRNSSDLHMTENWNLAVENSSGEWVIVLGGDDVIRKDALLKIDEATNSSRAQSVTWSLSVYTWKNFTIEGKSNLLSIPPTTPGFSEHKTITEINNLVEGKFSGLPSLYYGCIKRDLIDKALQSGPLLDSRCPDLYSASLFGLLTETFVRINSPLTIAGFLANRQSLRI